MHSSVLMSVMSFAHAALECPPLAHRVSWRSAATCPVPGVHRKSRTQVQTDAIDPKARMAIVSGSPAVGAGPDIGMAAGKSARITFNGHRTISVCRRGTVGL